MDQNELTIREEFDRLTALLAAPDSYTSPDYKKNSRRQAQLIPLINLFDRRQELRKDLRFHEEALSEPELASDARAEINTIANELSDLEQKIIDLQTPRDESDQKDAIVEIRAGAGGDEASLFAGELFRMYGRYAENQNWKAEIISQSPSEVGGFKEIIFAVHGNDVYSHLKHESGVHRVQRVPVTESGGRIHTSTATVAVLPEAEEQELEISDRDLRIDVFRSGGHGGQSVNTTDSAVRITHIPTGLVVTCQDEKSQLKNKQKALGVLRSRLLALKKEEEQKTSGDARRAQIGTGDRSEKIRTYNFPQDRVTDHRIQKSLHNLSGVLDGNVGPLLDELRAAEQKLAGSNL